LHHNLRFGAQHVADYNGYGNGVLTARDSPLRGRIYAPRGATVKEMPSIGTLSSRFTSRLSIFTIASTRADLDDERRDPLSTAALDNALEGEPVDLGRTMAVR